VATSDDVQGLATEVATMEALSDKLGDLVPELLARRLSITRAVAIA
jgi:hypothetical protein